MLVKGTVVDLAEPPARGRVVHVFADGRARVRTGDCTWSDWAPDCFTVVSEPGARDHDLRVSMCKFAEWSTDWERVARDEGNSKRAWDDLYDMGIDLLREFAKASGMILDTD